MDINVRLTASDLQEKGVFAALKSLCQCFGNDKYAKITPPPSGTTVANTSEPNATAAPTASAAPVPPVVPTIPTVPTAAPQYTLEMIAKAGTALIDAGKMAELSALLAKYGVEALTSLTPAHYGAFAADLRALGASI